MPLLKICFSPALKCIVSLQLGALNKLSQFNWILDSTLTTHEVCSQGGMGRDCCTPFQLALDKAVSFKGQINHVVFIMFSFTTLVSQW